MPLQQHQHRSKNTCNRTVSKNFFSSVHFTFTNTNFVSSLFFFYFSLFRWKRKFSKTVKAIALMVRAYFLEFQVLSSMIHRNFKNTGHLLQKLSSSSLCIVKRERFWMILKVFVRKWSHLVS